MDSDEEQASISFRLLDSKPRAAIVTARGSLLSPEAAYFRNTLDHVDSKEVRRVVLDLREVPYMSSSGIGVVVGYCKAKTEKEGHDAVAVIGFTPGVQNLMRSLGLSSLIPHFPDVRSAMKALGVEVDDKHLGEIQPE